MGRERGVAAGIGVTDGDAAAIAPVRSIAAVVPSSPSAAPHGRSRGVYPSGPFAAKVDWSKSPFTLRPV